MDDPNPLQNLKFSVWSVAGLEDVVVVVFCRVGELL